MTPKIAALLYFLIMGKKRYIEKKSHKILRVHVKCPGKETVVKYVVKYIVKWIVKYLGKEAVVKYSRYYW